MKKALIITIFFVLVLIVASCGGMKNIKIAPEKVSAIKKIVIIPMESPPLKLDSFVSQSPQFARNLGMSAPLVLIPDAATHAIGTSGVLFSSILMLAKLPESAKKSAQMEKTIDEVLNNKETWKPSIVIANLVADQLSQNPNFKIIVDKKEQKYPTIQKMSDLGFYERLKVMEKWYVEESPPFDYSDYLKKDIDCIMGIGIYAYGLNYPGDIWMMIHLKVIDPKSGELLGKAVKIQTGYRVGLEKLFNNNAEKLKKAVIIISQPLIEGSLNSCGLLR
jgi:hypothetical protein